MENNIHDDQIIKIDPITTTPEEKLQIKSIFERIVQLIREKHL